MTRLVLLSLLVIQLAGCANFQSFATCDVEQQTGLPILNPVAFNRRLISSQQIDISSEQGDFSFISQLELSNQKLTLVALTPVGQKLFQLIYKKGELQFQRFGVPDVINPSYLLTDISLIYGPRSALQRCFVDSVLAGQIIQFETDKRIFLLDDSRIEISYSSDQLWQSRVKLINNTRGYSINITPLALEGL